MLFLDVVVIAFGILMLIVIWLRDEDWGDKIIWVLFIVDGLVCGLAGLHLLRIFPLY